jgi:tRNA(Ile)-lysidine synthase
MKPAELSQKVRQTLYGSDPAASPFLSPTTTLIVALSGGPDSLTLLHLLTQLHPTDKLIAAHLDHAWRPTSAAEAQWVAKTAASWGVTCYIEQVDVIGFAREQGLTLEEAGRTARYQFLARVARQVGATIIATGHTADDQAETVLMHLLRGSGLAGLGGMRPVAAVPGAPDLTLIRPLLGLSRAEILAYCHEHNLTPIEDPTNADTTFFRNRLRHHLLPLLAEYNPQVREHLQTLAAVTAADYDFLTQLTQQTWTDILLDTGAGWLRFGRTKWSQQLPLSLRRSTLRHALSHLRPGLANVGFRTIEQAREVAEHGQVGSQSILPGGINLLVGYDDVTLSAGDQPPLPALPQLPDGGTLLLPVPGRLALANGWSLETTILTEINLAAIQANRDPWLAFIAGASIGELIVRPRQPGERFRPLGMGGAAATVKEVMINRKIPAGLRPRWPVVATAEHLAWLVGHQQDERLKVTEGSDRVIQLRAAQ